MYGKFAMGLWNSPVTFPRPMEEILSFQNWKNPLSPKRSKISEKDYLTKCDANGPLKSWPK